MFDFTKKEKQPIFDLDLIEAQSKSLSITVSNKFIEISKERKDKNFNKGIIPPGLLMEEVGLFSNALSTMKKNFNIMIPIKSLANEYIWAIRNYQSYWLMDVHAFLYEDLFGDGRKPNWTHSDRVIFDLFFKEKPYIEKTRFWDFEHKENKRRYRKDGWDVDNMAFFLEGENKYSTYYDWDKTFRESLYNSFSLLSNMAEEKEDSSLLDFMDFSFEDVRQDAYRDKIDPIEYGKATARNFSSMVDRTLLRSLGDSEE